MTDKQFYLENAGKTVRLKDKAWSKEGWSWTKNWEGFEAEIVGLKQSSLELKIIKRGSNERRVVGSIVNWDVSFLQVLEVIEEFISIPENQHPCPKCNQLVCIGFERLDCLLRG